MFAPVKAQWLAALRSEEYEQGIGYLKDDKDRYCCLGVLCDLAVKAKVIPEPILNLDEGCLVYGPDPENEDHQIYLPRAVKDWAGLPTIDPGMGDDQRLPHLSGMNDSGMSFAEIADAIEQHY